MSFYGENVVRSVEQALGDLPPRQPRTVHVTTPTGPIAMIRPIAEKLLKEGVISGDLKSGQLHAADAATVKAAVLTANICDFCSAPGGEEIFSTMDFDMPNGAGRSVGGWLACADCAKLVHAGDGRGLLDRSVKSMAFGKFTNHAIAELHSRFWKAYSEMIGVHGTMEALGDFIEDRMAKVELAKVAAPIRSRDTRMLAVSKLTGLSTDEVDDLAKGRATDQVLMKLSRWRGTMGTDKPKAIKQLMDLLFAGSEPKPMIPILPHWQIALDMRFAALRGLQQMRPPSAINLEETFDLKNPDEAIHAIKLAQQKSQVLVDNVRQDAKALIQAETYSFNVDTTQAILLASQTVLRETPLSAVETPGSGRAGWFWFAEPIPIQTSKMPEGVSALLWYWTKDADEKPFIVFTTFILRKGETPLGTVSWRWEIDEKWSEIVDGVRDTTTAVSIDASGVFSISDKAQVLKITGEMTLFFIAACGWMKQRVAVATPGHIERHARKRLQREQRLKEPPSVQVIALRRSARSTDMPATPREGDAAAREYHHQWVVGGHWRLQKVGPGRRDVKLIWIMPYTKGPEGAPLLQRNRVFAVVR